MIGYSLSKGKTITGRLWTYVRDDRPFGREPARRPCSTIRQTEPRPIPFDILSDGEASCRPMPMPGSMAFMTLRANLGR